MKFSFFLLLVLLSLSLVGQKRPKIGLALSGGGAKGLAHIGLLKAIDSAGINIDYVAGTSMGAIVGGLYASGYSGKEIAAFAGEMDWTRILSNKPGYGQLPLHQKQGADQFVEIPWVNNRPYFGKGVLESNELWLFLSNYFFPFIAETDFADLPRPFRCVATRLDNGEVVVLNSGNLVKSIRASMAIPSVFTPVKVGDNLLIDGGLVRNFPVSETKEMGADFIIGSSVAEGLLSGEDLNNPFQVINQIAFYGEQRDYKEQVEASDIFVSYPIGKYNAGSFGAADEILKMGMIRGEEMFPVLKRLKDSLDQIYGVEEYRELSANKKECVRVAYFKITGLANLEYSFFLKQMNFSNGAEYSPHEISEQIRTSFATGIFRKINYDIENNEDGSINVLLDFERDYRTFLKAGLGYNTETGLGIKLGATWYGLLGLFSSSSVAVSIGENPQLSAKNIHFLDKRRSLYLESGFMGEINELGTYNKDLAKIGIYKQRHFAVEMNLLKLVSKDFLVGIGSRYEFLNFNPEIKSLPEAKGSLNFLNSYFTLKYNSLDASFNPFSGNIINFEAGIHHNQNPAFSYTDVSSEGGLTDDDFKIKNYFTLRYYSGHYIPVKKHTVFLKVNSGIHFGNKLPYMNDFIVGGNNFVVRNQILFSGFRLNALSSSSVFSSQLGFRYNFTPRLSLAAASSFLLRDFVPNNFRVQGASSVLGFDLTAGYKSFVGPIEISLMYNSINSKIISTFNVGYSLNFSK